jgi:hypothetical protein
MAAQDWLLPVIATQPNDCPDRDRTFSGHRVWMQPWTLEPGLLERGGQVDV